MAGLFMIKDFQGSIGLPGVQILNVYGYKSNIAVINELTELLNAFEAQMLPKLIAVQQGGTDHSNFEAYELNGTGFQGRTLTSGNIGLRAGAFETGFLAWGFRYNRAAVGDRSGGKRIGLVADADVAGGNPVAGMITPLDDLAQQMEAPLKVGLIDTWFPVILERPVPPSTVWGEHPISGVNFTTVTSQNTRKS